MKGVFHEGGFFYCTAYENTKFYLSASLFIKTGIGYIDVCVKSTMLRFALSCRLVSRLLQQQIATIVMTQEVPQRPPHRVTHLPHPLPSMPCTTIPVTARMKTRRKQRMTFQPR